MSKNLVQIMGSIGLSEIVSPSADYGKLSATPVKVDAVNHKVGQDFIYHLSSKMRLANITYTHTQFTQTYYYIQAIIDVNTNGVEAAAATAISIVPYSLTFKVKNNFFLIQIFFLFFRNSRL